MCADTAAVEKIERGFHTAAWLSQLTKGDLTEQGLFLMGVDDHLQSPIVISGYVYTLITWLKDVWWCEF